MDLKTAEEELKGLKLPDWVKGLSVAEEYDIDGRRFLRVWVKVAPGFDVVSHYEESWDVETKVRQHLWGTGVEDWIQVSLTDGVTPD
jgi:hypothetical protein